MGASEEGTVFRSYRLSLLWSVACLLCGGCTSSSVAVLTEPPGRPTPPSVLGHGTVAAIASNSRVLIFPPNGDTSTREFTLPSSPNSLAFDTRGSLYIGFLHGDYFVREVNVQSGERIRLIDLKQGWSSSSVATDDHNVLYVNTKAFIGGDIKLFRPEDRDKPYLEIKDPLTPLTILVARSALWVGYYGAFSDALARYRLRSTEQTGFTNVGTYLPDALAVNPEGSLIAAKVRRHGKSTVAVYDIKAGRWKQIHEGDTQAMAADDSGNLYVAQKSGRILLCSFSDCPHSFETNLEITTMVLSPVDGMLYVASNGLNNNKSGIYVYNPRTTSLVRTIPMGRSDVPRRLAIEP